VAELSFQAEKGPLKERGGPVSGKKSSSSRSNSWKKGPGAVRGRGVIFLRGRGKDQAFPP